MPRLSESEMMIKQQQLDQDSTKEEVGINPTLLSAWSIDVGPFKCARVECQSPHQGRLTLSRWKELDTIGLGMAAWSPERTRVQFTDEGIAVEIAGGDEGVAFVLMTREELIRHRDDINELLDSL